VDQRDTTAVPSRWQEWRGGLASCGAEPDPNGIIDRQISRIPVLPSKQHSEETSAPIVVAPYDPSWPAKFESEKQLLARALAEWIAGPIEHVGSTSVPGLAAKPVIDIMVAVESLDASRPAISAAAQAGYIYWPYKADVMHWFCKPSDAHRTHHLHLVPYHSRLWQARLQFRDALRADPKLAEEYAQLKFRLAERHRHDREAYTQSKSGFVQRVLSSIDFAQSEETGKIIWREDETRWIAPISLCFE
jgi:GrpB-like predicted nucleotidyltransferase (UPF0157 family)